MVYPALLPLMSTPRLPAVDWTYAPADLNGLVRFAERRNLVSARVPSGFKRSLPRCCTRCFVDVDNKAVVKQWLAFVPDDGVDRISGHWTFDHQLLTGYGENWRHRPHVRQSCQQNNMAMWDTIWSRERIDTSRDGVMGSLLLVP